MSEQKSETAWNDVPWRDLLGNEFCKSLIEEANAYKAPVTWSRKPKVKA